MDCTNMNIDELIDNFAFFDTWEDKYRYIIELGEKLPPLPQIFKTDEWVVKGCQSQVWLTWQKNDNGTLTFSGDSDAMIVKGLIYIVLSVYNNLPSKNILDIDIDSIFVKLGLKEHLSPSRRNGLESMIAKIKYYAIIAA